VTAPLRGADRRYSKIRIRLITTGFFGAKSAPKGPLPPVGAREMRSTTSMPSVSADTPQRPGSRGFRGRRNSATLEEAMTKLLDKAFEAVKRLPAADQDEIAQTILDLAENGGEPEAIDPAHLPAVLEGLAQARRGEFSGVKDVEAAFRRFEK
jgi:hypothetical protein